MTTDLRALVKRRRTESNATTVRQPYCIDLDLAAQILALREERDSLIQPIREERELLEEAAADRQGKPDLSVFDAREAEATRTIDAEIDKLLKQAEELTFTLKFQAVPDDVYSKLAIGADEDDPASVRRFLNGLVRAGWVGVFSGPEEVDLGTFDDVWESLTFGECDTIRSKVFAANLKVADVPF